MRKKEILFFPLRDQLESLSVLNKESLFATFSTLLMDKTGLCYPKNRWEELEKKLQPLAASLGCSSSDCVSFLLKRLREDRLPEIVSHLSFTESYFFRDEAFYALQMQVLPDLIRSRATTRRLRIWSAGCCRGEEIFSVAMLLHHLLPEENWSIELIGSDINSDFLKKARSAHFTKWSLRATPAYFREQYFTSTPLGYKLAPHIQQMVKFSHCNLLHQNQLKEVDLILCHHLLLHFSPSQQEKIVQHLISSLSPNGWLSVSTKELSLIHHYALCPHRVADSIFFKKQMEEPLAVEYPEAKALPSDLRPIVYYQKAKELFGENRYREARQNLLHAIFLEPDYAAAHSLLALIENSRSQITIALQLLKNYQPTEILPEAELTAEEARKSVLALSSSESRQLL